jgi:hypothetical protein
MVMDHRLLEHHRQEFAYWFLPPPYPWPRLERAEVMRWWRVLHEAPDEILLLHFSGACARLTREGAQIVAVELVEGRRARELLVRHGATSPGGA